MKKLLTLFVFLFLTISYAKNSPEFEKSIDKYEFVENFDLGSKSSLSDYPMLLKEDSLKEKSFIKANEEIFNKVQTDLIHYSTYGISIKTIRYKKYKAIKRILYIRRSICNPFLRAKAYKNQRFNYDSLLQFVESYL